MMRFLPLVAVASASLNNSFVVLTAPRSGGEWFISVLDRHAGVCVSGEEARGLDRGSPSCEAFAPPSSDASGARERDDTQPRATSTRPEELPRTLCRWSVAEEGLRSLLRDDAISSSR